MEGFHAIPTILRLQRSCRCRAGMQQIRSSGGGMHDMNKLHAIAVAQTLGTPCLIYTFSTALRMSQAQADMPQEALLPLKSQISADFRHQGQAKETITPSSCKVSYVGTSPHRKLWTPSKLVLTETVACEVAGIASRLVRKECLLMHWAKFEVVDCAYLEMLLSQAIAAHG